ncbi:MAG TPA: hypothetical protein VHC70_06680 [Phycisphaerales bacterium]|nr:hypothetical protein [Phycisphaerales bacterium]
MKPHPRIRKAIKWGGAAVTVFYVVVWIGSAWMETGRVRNKDMSVVGVRAGQFFWGKKAWLETMPSPGGWMFGRAPFRLAWWIGDPGGPPFRGSSSPLWLPAGATLLFTLAAWRSDSMARRAHLNLCAKCGYDRTGLATSAVCPECGASGEARAGHQVNSS